MTDSWVARYFFGSTTRALKTRQWKFELVFPERIYLPRSKRGLLKRPSIRQQNPFEANWGDLRHAFRKSAPRIKKGPVGPFLLTTGLSALLQLERFLDRVDMVQFFPGEQFHVDLLFSLHALVEYLFNGSGLAAHVAVGGCFRIYRCA